MKTKTKILSLAAALLLALLTCLSVREYLAQQSAAALLTGTVEVTTTDITPKVSGCLQELLVKEGESIEAGALTARIERKDLAAAALRDELSLAQARTTLREKENGSRAEEIEAARAKRLTREATYERTEKDFRRAEALLTAGAISLAERDEARFALNEAQENEKLLLAGTREEELQAAREETQRREAVLAISQSELKDLTVLAPCSGVILTKNFEEGEYVSAGTPIATIADLSAPWVKVYVGSGELAEIFLGQKAEIYLGAGGKAYHGHIKEISDEAEFTPRSSITRNERENLVFAVKVELDDATGEIKPGMPADVRFL